MPSFAYYATFDESISILQDLCAQGFRVVAQPAPFDEPRAPEFDQVTPDLVEILRKAPGFYLAGVFSRFPVQFTLLEKGPAAGKYVIDLLSESPLMQCLVARMNVVNGALTLLTGDVSYQPEYRNPETGQWAKAPDDVKAAYRKAVATLKKRLVRHRAGIEIHIGREALALFEKGEARINDRQVVPPQRT